MSIRRRHPLSVGAGNARYGNLGPDAEEPAADSTAAKDGNASTILGAVMIGRRKSQRLKVGAFQALSIFSSSSGSPLSSSNVKSVRRNPDS